MQPTDEQGKIIACNDEQIVVNAYAGTGKTSTLCDYARYRPRKKFLYLAYNKAMQIEAAEKFGANVMTSTTHSLAYRSVGKKYSKKLGDLRPFDIAKQFETDYLSAKWAVQTISNFFASADPGIKEIHLPPDVLSGVSAGTVIDLAKKVWLASANINEAGIAMPHDGYLKIFAMTKPDLSGQFDTILFDEAQDANPVTSQIVFGQNNMQKIVVGDRYQAIYGFRGAFNAMESFSESDASHFYLTRSFRFGPEIASVASRVLAAYLGETRPLIGMREGKFSSTVDSKRPYTHIHRTNASLLRAAAWSAERSVPFSLLGGVKAYAFDRILDVYRLYARDRQQIKDAMIRRFHDFASLQEYAELADDIQLKSIAKLVEEYRHDTPGMIDLVTRRSIDISSIDNPPPVPPGHRPNCGTVTLTTAHRSKGLGFDQVLLSDDFSDLFDPDTGNATEVQSRQDREEINLIYVAATRAKHSLQLNDHLHKVQSMSNFEVQELARAANERLATPAAPPAKQPAIAGARL